FQSRFGLTGSVISAVDLVKGLGIYAGLEVVDVPGATGYLDTDYRAKALHALVALERKDFVYVHVEAPDEAAHMGSAEEKVRAIERFDQDLVGTLLNEMPAGPDYRIMVLPDHATPVEIRTHTGEPVPFLIYRPGLPETPGQTFDEESAARWGFRMERGWELMQKFVSGDPELV
ncbi:MAG: cofactor-independent phosphoglycerate mutase, partial [Thermoleophilia bacterium]